MRSRSKDVEAGRRIIESHAEWRIGESSDFRVRPGAVGRFVAASGRSRLEAAVHQCQLWGSSALESKAKALRAAPPPIPSTWMNVVYLADVGCLVYRLQCANRQRSRI